MLNWVIRNWETLVTAIATLAVFAVSIYRFIQLPVSEQTASFKEWLKYAVTLAESELGGGTGQLKLRFVYEMFVEKFSWLAKFITFEEFSIYVDDALVWLNAQLVSNKAISAFVGGATITTTASEEG